MLENTETVIGTNHCKKQQQHNEKWCKNALKILQPIV